MKSKLSYTLVTYFVLLAGLFAQLPLRAQEQFDKGAIVNKLADLLRDNYIFPETAKAMYDALHDNLKKGAYDDITDPKDFANALDATLKTITSDKHLRVISDTARVSAIKNRRPAARPKLPENNGFVDVQVMDGNIGYVDLRAFLNIQVARKEAKETMDRLIKTDAVVIDLRKNGGGSPSMVTFIANYFLENKPVHLNTFYFRPTDQTTELWTNPEDSPYHNTEIPLYILTSSKTGSAAEGFAYHLKHLKRAKIIGEKTAGAANPGGFALLEGSFLVFVPSGKVINPVTQDNWEGKGVIPHVKVPQDQALEKALELVREGL